MRVIRKKGTDSPVWPYHAQLAARTDMEVITVANPETPPAASPPPANVDKDKGSGQATGTTETKAEKPNTVKTIRAWLKDNDIDVPAGAKKGDLKKLLDANWK